MRLWTIHPKYLDPQGLVALWREALLARAVLRGETRGYRHHPQLDRFKDQVAPRAAINLYLSSVLFEADARGYSFYATKVGPARGKLVIHVNSGQVAHEWRHLLAKLEIRSPTLHRRWSGIRMPDVHPLFRITTGPIEPWERSRSPPEQEST